MLSNFTLAKMTNIGGQSRNSDRIFNQGRQFMRKKYANTNANLNNYKTVGVNHQFSS